MESTTVSKALLYTSIIGPPVLGGFAISASALHIPSCLALPNGGLQAQVWRTMFRTGAKIAPPFGLSSGALLAYQAYAAPTSKQRWLYAGSAVLAMLNVPFTLLLLMPTNNLLEGFAAQGDRREDVDLVKVGRLLRTWSTLNYIRGSFGIAAGFLALYAARL